MAQIMRGDLLHPGPLHRTGEPSTIGLRARQIHAGAEYKIVEAAALALHRQFIQDELRHADALIIPVDNALLRVLGRAMLDHVARR